MGPTTRSLTALHRRRGSPFERRRVVGWELDRSGFKLRLYQGLGDHIKVCCFGRMVFTTGGGERIELDTALDPPARFAPLLGLLGRRATWGGPVPGAILRVRFDDGSTLDAMPALTGWAWSMSWREAVPPFRQRHLSLANGRVQLR